jgi:hypothetical protein
MGVSMELKAGQYSFKDMWNLIQENHLSKSRVIFSDELLLAIIWEETGFRNIKGKVAAGFGQLTKTALLDLHRFNLTSKLHTQEELISDPGLSIKVTSLLLYRWYRIRKEKKRALDGYANSDVNKKAVPRWLAAEEALKALNLKSNNFDFNHHSTSPLIAAALNLASQAGWKAEDTLK